MPYTIHSSFFPVQRWRKVHVYRYPAGGYGFASPFKFDSLLSLVLYYATNTMEKHNPE